MANPTPNMGITKPTEGGSANVWDVILDAGFDVIDLHDHTTGKGVQVPTAGIGINANLTFAGFAATNLSLAQLTELSVAPLSTHRSLYTKTDHNLYWLTNSGVEVQVTSGSTLNVSIVGGIGGDYSSVGALFSYDDATMRYLAQQEGSPRPWAGLATADIDLYEKAASITNKVTLKSPAGLAASYSVTFPAAVPGQTLPVQMSSTGVLTASATVGTILVANDFKNTVALGMMIPAAGWLAPTAGGGVSTAASGAVYAVTLGTTNKYTVPVRLPVLATIGNVSVHIFKHSSNATTITAELCTVDLTTGTETVQSTLTNNDNGTGAATMTATGLAVQVTTDMECYIAVSGAADALDLGYQAQIGYTRA